MMSNLDLETSGLPTSTCLLKFTTLGLDIWFLVLVGTEAEMLDSLTRVLGTSQEKSVGSSWSSESQLVQSESLTTGGNNASAGSGSETESRNTKLGNGQESVVIGDGTNNDNGLVVGLLGGVRNNSRDGDGRSVDAGHEKAAEDDLVEGRLGSAGQEAIELHEQLEVNIVTLWRLSVAVAHMVSVEIDT